METKNQSSKLDKFFKWISFIASLATIFGVVIGTSYMYQITNGINASFSNTNNINVNAEPKTMEEELFEAQKYMSQEMYESAMRIYQKWRNSSAEANVNIGYMYSNGLGVAQDIEVASMYYITGYHMGNETGLINYLFVNLAKPTSYKQTITALRLGYDEENENTIKFIALLMTGKLESKFNSGLKEVAEAFWNLSEEEQIERLLKYTIENIEYIEQLQDEEMPSNTDFITYMYTTINGTEYLYKCIAGYVEVYNNLTETYNWMPVYDVKNYYSKHSKHFIYADLLFEEQSVEH